MFLFYFNVLIHLAHHHLLVTFIVNSKSLMFQSVSNKPLHQMEQTLVTILLCLSSSYYMIFVPFGHSHVAAMVNSAI